MKALVTGASGFVGSAVVRELLLSGFEVRAMLRTESDGRNVHGLPLEIVRGDLEDHSTFPTALRGCQVLFHVAADYRLWVPKPRSLYRINVDSTEALLRAAMAAGVDRIVYTSSAAALGHPPGTALVDESTPSTLKSMLGHYKRSKYLAEQRVLQLIAEEGCPATIVNPTAPVGPRDIKPTPTGRMVLDAARGRMWGYVDTGLNLVHVDDVAHGHLLAYVHGRIGERYILGGRNLPLIDVLRWICLLVDRPPPRLRLPHGPLLPLARLNEMRARLLPNANPRLTVDALQMSRQHMYFSTAKAERELDYRARPVQDGLREAIAWFRSEGYLS